jgi:outer membrane protein assembly factor BamB
VFISTADEETARRLLLCFDLETGSLLWSTSIHEAGFMAMHAKNSHASPTPACDGTHIYVPYIAEDALWTAAVTLDGRIAWKSKVGPFVSRWGYGPSPVLYRHLLIMNGDNPGSKLGPIAGTRSYLAALHRQTGEIVWRVLRAQASSYGTPVVAELAGRPQLLLSGKGAIVSYEPTTGNELWHCRWSAARTAGSLVGSENCVFASTNFPEPEIICIRADSRGDVTDSHIVWRKRKNAADIPSPLYHDGLLYVISDKGMIQCLDANDGGTKWQRRLATTFWASPLLCEDRVYAVSEDGTTYVFRAGPVQELLACNPLPDQFLASPAAAGERLLLRGVNFLWCLGEHPEHERNRVKLGRIDPTSEPD